MMPQKSFFTAEEITDQDILEAFNSSDTVMVFTQKPGRVENDRMSVGGLGWQLPMARVLRIIGITPALLRMVYDDSSRWVKRPFPFNLRWFGLNQHTRELVSPMIPDTITRYDELGSLPLTEKAYLKFAIALDRKIMVFRDYGAFEEQHVFTVDPNPPALE